MVKVVGISGSLTHPSRTRALVESIALSASQKLHSPIDIIDIAEIARDLGGTISYQDFPPRLTDAFAKIKEADLLIIASPVYKASYAGLFKHFFDLLDPKVLVGKVGILAATGGSDQHASIIEYQLRTLASFFNVYTTPTGIYAKDVEFVDYKLTSEAIHKRIDVAVEQATLLLNQIKVDALVA